MCRREMQRLEEESERAQTIITNYKQICSDLSHRLEKSQTQQQQTQRRVLV
jgi:hypothetical protein